MTANIVGLSAGQEHVIDLSKLEGHRYVHVVEQRQKGRCCVPPFKTYTVVSPGTKTSIYSAHEELDTCCRKCGCLWQRDFDLRVESGEGTPAYYFYHHRICCEWMHCLHCCNHRMQIYEADPSNRKQKGKKVGSVESDFLCGCSCIPNFTMRDADGKISYQVRRDMQCEACPCLACCYGGERSKGYIISSGNGTPGGIYHLNEQRAKAMIEDSYQVTFPEIASEVDRVLMVAATILVDYDLYDDPPKIQEMRTTSGDVSATPQATPGGTAGGATPAAEGGGAAVEVAQS